MKSVMRWLLSAILATSGTLHFVHAGTFLKIMPPMIPWPEFWVAFTGACELAASVGLQVPKLRRITAWCLVIFLITIFPANVQMALKPHEVLGYFSWLGMSETVWAWLRLPLQVPLVLWAWRYTREEKNISRANGGGGTNAEIG